MKRLILIILICSIALSAFAQNNGLVVKVLDGDTLKLADGRKVRLIGIDTPEMRLGKKLRTDAQRTKQDSKIIMALGRRSYQFTRHEVEGKTVRLEFDVQRYDKYGRLLAYVFIPVTPDMKIDTMKKRDKRVLRPLDNTGNDELFLNAYIVEQGFANLMTIPPNVKYADLFSELYQEARENNRGLWK